LIFLLIGCTQKTPTIDKNHFKRFANLTLQEKRYVYHLRKANSLNEKEGLITELEFARQFAPASDNRSLAELLDYLKKGDKKSFQRYNDTRKENTSQPVKFNFQVPVSIDTSSGTISIEGKVLIQGVEFNSELKLEHNRMGGVTDVKISSTPDQ